MNWPALKTNWSHFKDLNLTRIETSKVTVLLGREVIRVNDVLDSRITTDREIAPDSILTHFGWCLAEPVRPLFSCRTLVTNRHQ